MEQPTDAGAKKKGGFSPLGSAQDKYRMNVRIKKTSALIKTCSIYLSGGWFGLLWEIIIVTANLLHAVLFVIDTYHPFTVWVRPFQATFAGLYIVDYIIHFTTAPVKTDFVFFHFQSYVDYISIPLIIYDVFAPKRFTVPVAYFRVTRLSRFLYKAKYLPILRDLKIITNALAYQITRLLLKVFLLVWIFAGVFMQVDNANKGGGFTIDPVTNATIPDEEDLEFFSSFYYLVVTFSTVGYGDIGPRSAWSQAVVILIIGIGLTIIPAEIGAFVDLMSQTSKYGGSFKRQRRQHVLVTGHINDNNVAEFLREFYHKDHGEPGVRTVVLAPDEPNRELVQLMEQPEYTHLVSYVKGTAISHKDLDRVKAGQALACFLMVDPLALFSEDVQKADAEIVMKAISLKRYIAARDGNAEVITMLLKDDYIPHLVRAGIRVVGSVEGLKMGLIGYSCVVPGMSTLIANLVVTGSSDEHVPDGAPTWMRDYLHCRGQEFYSADIPAHFKDASFADAAIAAYNQHGILLFGVVYTFQDNGKDSSKIILNPGKRYHFTGGEQCFLISDSKPTQDIMNSIDLSNAGDEKQIPLVQEKKGEITKDEVKEETGIAEEEEKQEQEVEKELLVERAPEVLDKAHDFSKMNLADIPYGVKKTPEYQDYLDKCLKGLMKWQVADKDHVIIANSCTGLQHMLRAIRASDADVTVVIVHDELPTERFWDTHEDLKNVYFVLGSVLDSNDRVRCRFEQAVRIVILSDGCNDSFGSGEQSLKDWNEILSYIEVEHASQLVGPALFSITEISSESNVMYFGTPRIMDHEVDIYNAQPFASGNVFCVSVLDNLIFQEFYKPYISELVNSLLSDRTYSVVRLLRLPEGYEGKRFGELLEYYMNSASILSIALYRGIAHYGEERIPGEEWKPFPLVNPDRSVVLHKNDKVIACVPKSMVAI